MVINMGLPDVTSSGHGDGSLVCFGQSITGSGNDLYLIHNFISVLNLICSVELIFRAMHCERDDDDERI